ncbi:hypothetical protein ACX9P6_004833, partial [Citrobacter braakii]
MMKKTLVALALAATTVSGSAMAWQANGTGGSLELGGTFTPTKKDTPWEILIGPSNTSFNVAVSETETVMDIPVVTPISILGIRTQVPNNSTFTGSPGIAPQINYGSAIDIDGFNRGVTSLKLDIHNVKSGSKIGLLTTKIYAVSESSQTGNGEAGRKSLIGAKLGDAFYGGLGKRSGTVDEGVAIINTINPEYTAHYNTQGAPGYEASPDRLEKTNAKYSAFYGAGVKKGENLRITLDAAVGNEVV